MVRCLLLAVWPIPSLTEDMRHTSSLLLAADFLKVSNACVIPSALTASSLAVRIRRMHDATRTRKYGVFVSVQVACLPSVSSGDHPSMSRAGVSKDLIRDGTFPVSPLSASAEGSFPLREIMGRDHVKLLNGTTHAPDWQNGCQTQFNACLNGPLRQGRKLSARRKVIADKTLRPNRYYQLLKGRHRLLTLVYTFPSGHLYFTCKQLLSAFFSCAIGLKLVLTCAYINETPRIAALPYLTAHPIAKGTPRRSDSKHGRCPRDSRFFHIRPSICDTTSRTHIVLRRQCDALEHKRGTHRLCRSACDLAIPARDCIIFNRAIKVCLHEPMVARRLAAAGIDIIPHHMVCAAPNASLRVSANSAISGSSVSLYTMFSRAHPTSSSSTNPPSTIRDTSRTRLSSR
jgi:hypothetical protein